MFSSRHPSQIVTICLLSVALPFVTACNRDPNVRKQKYLESGKHYEETGKYKEAAIQFANALKVDKGFAPAHFELAKTYLKLSNGNLAYAELMRTIELDPKNQEARITAGNLLLAGGAPVARAEEQAKAVLALNPNSADAYALLAAVAQSQGDKDGATKNIEKALSLDPNRSGFHSALAMLRASSSDEPAAEQELTKAATLDPKNATPHLLLGELYGRKGNIQGAQQQFQAAVAAAPANAQARGALAALYVRSGDNSKAEQVLMDGVNANPDQQVASATLLEFYARTGQVDHAKSTFAALTSKYPKSLPIKVVYARILLDRKDYSSADSVVHDLVKMDAGNTEVQTLNAMLLVGTGKIDDAVTLLKKSVKDNPNNVPAQVLLGRVALLKGDAGTAQTAFSQAVKLAPANADAENGIAEIAMRNNDPSLLSATANRMIETHPEVAQGYLWRGMSEAATKLYEKASADYQTALQKAPNNPAVYVAQGQLYLSQNRPGEAQAVLEKALDKDPNSTRAMTLLVISYMQAKQPAKAIARLQAQVAKQPQNGFFYAQLADLQLKNNDLQGAVGNSQKALQLAPGIPDVAAVYTRAQVASGNIDGAITVWQNWLNTHPTDALGPRMLGTLEEAKGDKAKAQDFYKKALQLNPNDPIAANNLAFIMADTGQNADVALSLAQTARRVMPDSAQTADTLAWVYYAKGDYSAARDLLESSIRNSPDEVSLQYHLGMTYIKLKDKPNAQAHLKKAQTLGPNTKFGQDAGAQLQKL